MIKKIAWALVAALFVPFAFAQDLDYGEGECYDQMYASNERYVLERDPNTYSFAYALRHLNAN